jgi:transposase-like protein
MNLVDINTLFPSDEKCRELLNRLRWPAGVECPRCKMPSVELETAKQLFYCKDCDYQFSVTAGTVFNDSHLPLTKWFLATLLLCEAKKGMSACQIQRTLGISYKTAWYLCHRIRHAMAQCDKPMLDGKVEIDETYVGGKARGRGRQFCGRGTEKEPVIGIRQRGGDLRFFHAQEVRTGVLEQFIRDNVSEDVEAIFTDELNMYKGVAQRMGIRKKHHVIRHRSGIYVRGDVHTNTVESAFSLLKRGIIGTWHRVSAKHLQAYCEEMSFRFNRRKNPNLFTDTLRHMITASALTFERLTA